ncbi:hypothetical protein H4R33_001111 [Dimargaris cristalligena]|nr:hypothetical protein H4R33_001111 [Dimargaris cristalligena]
MAKYKNSFRASAWDPIMIIAQIAAFQSISYVSLGLLITAAQVLLGLDSSLDHALHYTSLRSDTVFGWTLAAIWLVQAIVGILLLGYIVERVRLCVDFTLTFFGIHLVMVSVYSHRLPNFFFWWLVSLVYVVVTILGGEWFCMRREMRPIQFGSSADNEHDGDHHHHHPDEMVDDANDMIMVGSNGHGNGGRASSSSTSDQRGRHHYLPLVETGRPSSSGRGNNGSFRVD